MKKKINLIICVFLAVALFATFLVGCVDPTPPDNKTVKYAVIPIADLTDYSSTANKAAVVYTVDADYTDARNNLEAKIKTEKSYYDAFAAGEDEYYRYTATDLENGTATPVTGRYEDGERVEQSSLIKILAHADADQLIYVLGYSGLEKNKMISLIDYIAKDGTGAMDEANISKATGLIEDYEAIQKWSDVVDVKGTSTTEGQTAYKNRTRKSRAMNKRLFDTGMDGGDAGRAVLEVLEYVQIIAEEMREVYNGAHQGAILDDMTEFFKKELLDYDTVVLIRANNDRRWGTAGQVKTAMNKEVVYDEGTHSYAGSYAKPASADAALVKAYGYSFEYERGNYNALNDADFEKELTYRFKNSMTTDEAKDYSRIQRTQYEKAFRYSENFYKTYYEALNPINAAQEKYEGAVFGFTNIDRAAGDPFYGVSSIIKVQGVGGDMTEPEISVDLGGNSAGSYSTMTYNALQIGLADQLKAGDMQHYYWGIEKNIIDQNNANNDRMSSNNGSQAKGAFNLRLVNLKMADFVLSTFVAENNAKGLTNIMKAQTRLYVADYTRMVKAFRRQVIRQLAEFEKEGVLTAKRDGNDIVYELVAGQSYSPEQQEAVRDNIGRASAMINILDGKRIDTNIDNRDSTLGQTKWTTISSQIKETATHNYDQYGKDIAWGKKSKVLEDLLIKKNADGSYDTNWATSVFVSNNANVLAYSSGQIIIDFRIATANDFSQNSDVITEYRTSFGDVYGYSGDTLKTIIDAQNYDENNIAQGISFAEVNLNGGRKYKANVNKFYLSYVYTAANVSNGTPESGKYYYEVLPSDVMDYDIRLHVSYSVA